MNARGDTEYVDRSQIECRGIARTVSVPHTDHFFAAGSFAEVYVGDRRFIVREPLHVLERRLDPREFMRIHQSIIVRLACVTHFIRAASGDHEIRLTDGTRLSVSRSRREMLEQRLAALDGASTA